jgi:hypothetical protein
MARLLASCAFFFAATFSHAAEDDVVERARAHFEAGEGLYRLGEYQGAVAQFAAGFDLVPRVEFLLNLGQCYRQLHDVVRAQEMLRRFLAAAPPTHPRRADVEALLRELEAAPSTAPARATAPVAPPAVAAAPPAKRSLFARTWWIIPVVAAVFAGAVVGTYFAAQPASACNGASACLHF